MANAVPNTPYIDVGKGKPNKPMSDATKKLIDDGWNLKQRRDVLDAELKVINDKLIKKHPGVSLIVPGQCRCPIARSTTIKIKEDDGISDLKTLFGRKFSSFVNKVISHAPTAELKKIAQDKNHELHTDVSDCLDVTHGAYGIRWNTAK